jgi:hypothetical protein
MSKPLTITTADGVTLKEGDRVYSHYTMSTGTIGPISTFWKEEADPWFDFIHADGKHDTLNGDRVCSLDHAKRMGWPNVG